MTAGRFGCLCVAIVLLFTICALEASPESTHGQNGNIKIQETQKKSPDVVSANGRSVTSKTPLIFDCVHEDTECNKDKFGYEAIIQLHRLIDDDRNGNVDQSESDEFLRDELQYTDGFERHSLFHNNDKLISVEDLWRAWKYSEVYNWTVDDVVEWLRKEVDLPQYASIFSDNSVSGPFLPRLAASNTFMTAVLGIKNPVHKQKLSLKAMDTVLFGAPPKRHNYMKDVALMVSLIFAIGGCWFAYLHHRFSQEQVRKMMMDLESLQKAEEALMDVQRKLEDAENRQVSTDPRPLPAFKEGTAVPDADLPLMKGGSSSGRGEGSEGVGEGTQQIREELAATLLALQHAETQLEHSWAPPGELQAWLQLTHELEQAHYTAKRQAAERQFQAAKEVCDKIKRRNKAFFGSLRMAHSNSLDEIDQRILDAKAALEEVKQDLQERLHRWHTMERLCGFPIISNPGLSTLHQLLYGAKDGPGNGTRLPAGVVGSVDEAEEDLPPAAFVFPVANGMSRSHSLTPDMDSVGPLPYTLFPDTVHVEKERQAAFKRATFRLQSRLSFPSLAHSVSSKSFLRQRAAMGSTGSLSHLSRNAVSVNAAYSAHHPPPLGAMHQRGSHDLDATPSPTSPTASNPVSFHLGDQVPTERSAPLCYKTQHSLPGAGTHTRSKSITSSTVSSVSSAPAAVHPFSGYHGHVALSSSGVTTTGGVGGQALMGYSAAGLYTLNRAAVAMESDDNVSQATMDSLPGSQSSHSMRERHRLNNGLDLVSHTQGVGQDSGGGGGGVGGSLGPCLLEKKPSKRKKLLNMFRKSSKQKPV
ncbi:stromal interaction molecule 2-like isoform X2 [Babylonia areolata]|uniref:stromal interaction molecule 2-like isoform X2 n=1 Tax=Babylonia areolata TaxID=304850 RepID=UPI003FD65129